MGAQQGLDKPSFSRVEKNRNQNADDVSLAKQLLAYAHIFTLGNNKHASLRRIAGLETLIQPRASQWLLGKTSVRFLFKKKKTCGVQVLLNPHIQILVIQNLVM